MKFRSFVALAAASALAAGVAATEPVAKKPAGTAEPIDQKQIQGKPDMSASSYLTIPFKTITGHDSTLAAFKGKVVLIVNTASQCGLTPQYQGLEALYETYKGRGLVILGFPCNQFGGQGAANDT